MNRYGLIVMAFLNLIMSRVFATQLQGGLRFSGNEKLIVKKNSIFRKFLLKKKNRDDPLKIFKVVPFAVNLILFSLVLLLYAIYAIFYTFPIGIEIGNFLNSIWSGFLGAIWFIILGIYVGIINAI